MYLQRHSSSRRRGRAQIAALTLLAVAALGGTATGTAHAIPDACDGGPCHTPPPPPGKCLDCNSGATKPPPKVKLVTVYRATSSYSTPYASARARRPLRATVHIATCEARSEVGRFNNPWWTRLRDGYWVHNGDLRGLAKMGLGDCPAPANDGLSRGGRQGCDDCKPAVPPPPPPRGGRQGCDDCKPTTPAPPPPRGGRQGCDGCGPPPPPLPRDGRHGCDDCKPPLPYRAGQHIHFKQTAALPNGRGACTAGFVLRLYGLPVGLTAGHCSKVQGERIERFVGQVGRTGPDIGDVFINTHGSGPDALIFRFAPHIPSAIQEIERGAEQPLIVDGKVDTADQKKGVKICFNGLTSAGCGRIASFEAYGRKPGELICVRAEGKGGTSGGPVYLKPVSGRTRAVGIVTAGQRAGPLYLLNEMCYTPIDTILKAFNATFPTGTVALPRR